MNNVYIPKKFKLSEFLHSDTALEKRIENIPSWQIIEKLRLLGERLDIYREALGEPIIINSGFRSPKLNVAVGGSKTSHHCKGDAVDLHIGAGGKLDAIRLYNFIKEYNEKHNLDVDQLLIEHKKSNNSWWVHLGLNVDNPEKMRNYYGSLTI